MFRTCKTWAQSEDLSHRKALNDSLNAIIPLADKKVPTNVEIYSY